ncbi:MAG: S26 family signal peptidase [Pseudomonadota bacterium]
MTGAPILTSMFGGAACLLLAITPTTRPPRLVFNTTASAPLGFYLVDAGVPVVGDMVVVRPPRDLALWMAARGYLPSNVPLIKRVAASGGQTVCGGDGEVHIDGNAVAKVLPRDRHGRRLAAFTGCVQLADGDVFLLNTESPYSLDGRYFGPLRRDTVVGRATAIWTWSAG